MDDATKKLLLDAIDTAFKEAVAGVFNNYLTGLSTGQAGADERAREGLAYCAGARADLLKIVEDLHD
jgi:hypothetical protein